MTTMNDGFADFDQLIIDADRAALPPWDGAPLRFHQTYTSPDQLDAAWQRHLDEHGHFGCVDASHMWHNSSWTGEPIITTETGPVWLYTASLRSPATRDSDGSLGPSLLLYQMIDPARHWHTITADENMAVEAWHDIAFPQWRQLPVLPMPLTNANMKPDPKAIDFITSRYPRWARVQGAPVLTQRTPGGTRHVPGRSPYGGYDLGTLNAQ